MRFQVRVLNGVTKLTPERERTSDRLNVSSLNSTLQGSPLGKSLNSTRNETHGFPTMKLYGRENCSLGAKNNFLRKKELFLIIHSFYSSNYSNY